MASQNDNAGKGRLPGLLWLALAVAALLSVLILNGRPLFYFDTGGYVNQGETALGQLGWKAAPAADVPASGAVNGGAAPGAAADMGGKGTVDGSRSAVYALVAGIFARIGALEGLIVLNVLAVLASVWLAVRVALRETGGGQAGPHVAVPIIVACLGALPFYVAYLMPDTLAPVMILCLATLAAFGRQMRLPEILLALALASFAVVAHLSHLAIAALMVPVALAVSLYLSRQRWWLPPLLCALVAGVGYSERLALRAAAHAVAGSEVVIKPYITARLIQDGPGREYLEHHCPNPQIATCDLFAALSKSDDPMRFTASHIVFETSPELGSFRLMTPEQQRRVSNGQVGFFLDVLKDAPMATTLAFVRNTLVQTSMFRIDMTLPTPAMERQAKAVHGSAFGPLVAGHLAWLAEWMGPLTLAQGIFYSLSALVILALVVSPGPLSAGFRALAVMVVAGVLINALVCGGISQPATRYGARVIWLLPLMATMLIMFALRGDRTRGVE
jgi:hypothetical protein